MSFPVTVFKYIRGTQQSTQIVELLLYIFNTLVLYLAKKKKCIKELTELKKNFFLHLAECIGWLEFVTSQYFMYIYVYL